MAVAKIDLKLHGGAIIRSSEFLRPWSRSSPPRFNVSLHKTDPSREAPGGLLVLQRRIEEARRGSSLTGGIQTASPKLRRSIAALEAEDAERPDYAETLCLVATDRADALADQHAVASARVLDCRCNR